MRDQVETIELSGRAEWRAWLEQHHATSHGVWLIMQKKGSSREGLHLLDAVEEALCFGWIDTHPETIDSERYKLFLSPRHSKSIWSKHTKARIERLIRQGLMTEAGLKVVRAAQEDGSWRQLEEAEQLIVPADLGAALAAQAAAETGFAALTLSAKKIAIWSVMSARRPETRARRIRLVVAQAIAQAPAARRETQP